VNAVASERLPDPNPVIRAHTGSDATEILNAIGEALYVWYIASDRMIWRGNAAAVLQTDAGPPIATSNDYALLIEAEAAASRTGMIVKSDQRDGGDGVPYRFVYSVHPAGTLATKSAAQSPRDPRSSKPDAGEQSRIFIEEAGRWFAGADGKPAYALGGIRDVTERRMREDELMQRARRDSLTGELNRQSLAEQLGETLDATLRFRSSCGFLLIAIDNLAQINRSYGFDAADAAIAEMARRLRRLKRGKDMLGRFSGNKFGVILTDCTANDLAVAAERFLAGIRDELITTPSGPIAVTASIGGITAPRYARSAAEMQSRAQEALDDARMRQPGSFLAYRPDSEQEARQRDNIRATDEIVAALGEQRVFLAYDTVVTAHGRNPVFYESLMRVRRTDGSTVGAGEIVPVAERLGLVRLLDRRVLELAIDEMIAAPSLRVSVNVSASSTTDRDWWDALVSLLREHAAVAERLIIEITESAAIRNVDETRSMIVKAKELGCRIAIDDFGAGYTSFRNLRALGADTVKIDGEFIRNLITSEDNRAFVQTLVDLAKRLKLDVVAEWVQDEATARLLEGWGCDFLQGSLIGHAATERPWLAQTPQRGLAKAV
jgi:diguanylate cyclase (GGDEF)-like protein